jgi:hypothetical protein
LRLANGEEIITYKSQILSKLLNDEDICQLILNHVITDFDDSSLHDSVQEHILPYWFIPNVSTTEGSFITFDLGSVSEGEGDVHKKTTLGMFIYSHHNLMKCSFAPFKTGTRVDLMNVAVQKIFNGNYDFGLGQMKLTKDIPKQINNVYYGRELSFAVSDFSNYEESTNYI